MQKIKIRQAEILAIKKMEKICKEVLDGKRKVFSEEYVREKYGFRP